MIDPTDTLWQHSDVEASEHINVPVWIEQDITCGDIAGVIQGGCESGAYMPAVTYYQAMETMRQYSDDVFDQIGDVSEPSELIALHKPQSWEGMAVLFVSAAVEMWAHEVMEDLADCLETEDEDAE